MTYDNKVLYNLLKEMALCSKLEALTKIGKEINEVFTEIINKQEYNGIYY